MTTLADAKQPSRQTAPPSASAPGAPAFVWGAWALLLLAALAFVAGYGSDVPVHDEWDGIVPQLTGHAPVTAGWLWAQHFEYRIPLPKLLMLALFALGGGDFRAGMFFNVLALGGLAFALIRAAASLRGGIRYADAFFPVALLHWGHWENFLMHWQVAYTLPVILACALLLIIARSGAPLTPRAAALAGACLLSLPLCGAAGLAYVPPLALWLGYAGVAGRRSPEPAARRAGLVLLACAPAALLLAGLYFIGYQKPYWYPYSPGLRATLKTTVEFLSLGLGPAVRSLWPYSALVVPGLLFVSVTALVLVGWNQKEERLRVLGLLSFLGGAACLALAVGWGRAAYSEGAGFTPRYVTLAVPLLCCLYLVWCLYSPTPSRRFFPMCLCVLACFLLPMNLRQGLIAGRERRARMAAFERDARAGAPTFLLARRYAPLLHPSEEALAHYLQMMQHARIGPFRPSNRR